MSNTANRSLAPRASTAPSGGGAQVPSRAKRRALLALAGATLACLTTVGAGPANADQGPAQWQWYNLDAVGCSDAAVIDRDFNGYLEDQWFDTDNDCILDMHLYNSTGGDSFLEVLTFDGDNNGVAEVWLQDTDQREGFDYVYRDQDQNGYYESVSTSAAAHANAAATSEQTMLEQQGTEGQFWGIMANWPSFVSNPAELPTITPLGLL